MRPWHVAIMSLAAVTVVVGLVFASERTQAHVGYITTVAGSGPGGYPQGGYSGDGGPATSARLNDPKGVVLDSSGNLYIGDNGNSRIRMVSTSGIIITVAGNGTYTYCGDGDAATEACLWNPFGVALDSSGNLYIADLWNGRIRKVVPGSDGVVNGGPDEIITTVAGGGGGCTEPCPATDATLGRPNGVAVGSSGNLYVAAELDNRIRMVDISGTITTVAGGGSGCPGQTNTVGDGCPATSASVYQAEGVTLDSVGNLYIADTDHDRVRKVVPGSDGVVNGGSDEIITTVAGGGGGCTEPCPATDASLGQPESVAVDSSGNVYIGDQNNNRARKVDTSGVITTVAGEGTAGYSGDGGPATEARLDHLFGVALDSSESLHVGDSYNHRIRKVEGLGAPVGGIAGLPDVAGSSGPNYALLAAAVAPTILALTAGAWYARRRWLA